MIWSDIFDSSRNLTGFQNDEEYMEYLFSVINYSLNNQLAKMKIIFSNGQGDYKNVLYPDLETAYDVCMEKATAFLQKRRTDQSSEESEEEEDFKLEEDLGEELLSLFADYFEENQIEESIVEEKENQLTVEAMLDYLRTRAQLSIEEGKKLPFYQLCQKMNYDDFTLFTFACGILSSLQVDYAGVFQIINENGSYSAPTIEVCGRLYYGEDFSITKAYGRMSHCLESLKPIIDLQIVESMPFSTVVALDKRVIDYLFGYDPGKTDENYRRFFSILMKEEELDPIMANQGVLDAMEISYSEGVRIFSYYGDEGSGRKFFVKHFCKKNGLGAIAIDCKKLFEYDYGFVDRALWAVTRECILANAACCMEELTYREDEKEKFFGYMDLAFAKLTENQILVFALSKDKINFKEITKQEFTQLELPTPGNQERENCWTYFAKNYALEKDVSLSEMATKFLFTPGKIKAALSTARSYATMDRNILIPRNTLFKGCNNQMSSELTQKATRVDAKFGFEDIVMNKDQRETLEHAIDQMNFRKQVYDKWDYNKKYPYGRGLSILLFGAPGTGKSMCAQVIAHELNLELYRVDLSKVIDKYVGETEKSISMIFREAKKCNVVLFFDECDTLFAKRSDDGGSNQASNNNKTALLLQEVEAYDGVSVLATNYKHNIDPAFFRRMKYIVEFQFPDADTREMLWKTTIPKGTPLG
ncbi:MAG: ATP-binding protein, partial [Lachnospiraceae bacterium]|nr:ATP-binding protein [Lachnospiraceae bacterium]